ncbi:hypothetical protein AGMMS49545_20720 [Betaproteobacteria bacterium]|nr:hypothetical protein AGMMS49545_20720 [Betaproteobacteria bacterium]GHU48069.1 hypothetical protein AGMMS50289_24190 [Betaproteobacteria bacterium]
MSNNKYRQMFQVPKHSFERTIVGFDLRKSSSLNNLFMTSYDDSVRYEALNESFQDQQSGLNLFYIDPSAIPSLTLPVDARIIAFDLPSEFVAYLSCRNVSNPQPLPTVDINNGWAFMGFDVVDAITQTSAFHGFDLTTSLSEIIKKCSLRFNGHGLLDDREATVRSAEFFDDLIPEHAPFMPCGVWLKYPPAPSSTKLT